jgi:MerR family transcriptional regulator, light-induced transcriptional regulator
VDSDDRYASTAQVAEALGVSVTTIKRWVDDGVLPARKTVGGHRKVRMADVVRLVREARLPQADISRLVPRPRDVDLSNPDLVAGQLRAALQDADAELVAALLHGAYRHGYPMEVLADRVIGPAVEDIGRAWEVGQLDVMHEHRATQVVVSAMYELQGALRSRAGGDRPVAVGGAPAGDPTLIPTLLAKLVLADAGWDAVNLGPHTPAGAFISAMHELRPRLVWVCVTHLDDADGFLGEYREVYRGAEERGIAVAVGGRGLSRALRERMPYTTFGNGMTHLTAFARTLYQRPPVPRKGRPPRTRPAGRPEA